MVCTSTWERRRFKSLVSSLRCIERPGYIYCVDLLNCNKKCLDFGFNTEIYIGFVYRIFIEKKSF
ncbi:hypothetical protein Scep_012614 [Stephania cephalantha]|uniref:Uncharacterized protein n=1 Tax=Stephania cephalantha TaxID=152367 RepID=A0AAP0JF95_9MAGN